MDCQRISCSFCRKLFIPWSYHSHSPNRLSDVNLFNFHWRLHLICTVVLICCCNCNTFLLAFFWILYVNQETDRQIDGVKVSHHIFLSQFRLQVGDDIGSIWITLCPLVSQSVCHTPLVRGIFLFYSIIMNSWMHPEHCLPAPLVSYDVIP